MSWVQVKADQNHMATTFELEIRCEADRARAAEQTLRECHAKISELEAELSEFRADSPVARLNEAKAFAQIPLTAHLRELLQISELARDRSKGAFNPLCKSRGRPGLVLLSQDKKTLFKTEDGVRLSFGAIGKGYALDVVRVLIEQVGFSNYLLSGGGSSVVLAGFAAPGVPWNFAWSWKKDDSGLRGKRFVHATGRPIALGISGTMEQGQHILGSRSSTLSTSPSLSALVGHGSAALADAFSTALFVSGWDDISFFRDPLHAVPLAWIDNEENIRWNGDFQTHWGAPC